MANEKVPVYERKVSAETASIPDFGSTYREMGASQNTLSAIGAKVTQSASNQMASQLGYESGKTPHGDLLPPITEFDKTFADSYHAQSAATLTVQADNLLTNADIEMSKPNKLTPGLIESTNNQLRSGLQQIAAQAPTAIKGKLEAEFASQLMSQNHKYATKMIGQQREEQKNNMIAGIAAATRNAYELSSNGDEKGAQLAVEKAKAMSESAAANNFITKEEANVSAQSARQAYLTGKYTNEAISAQKNGKLDEFDKNLADKPAGMTNKEHYTTIAQVQEQMNYRQTLLKQNENLLTAKMNNRIASDVGNITGAELEGYRGQVSPIEFEQTKLRYINALKANSKANEDVNEAIRGFTNPDVMAHVSDKAKNDAYDKNVQATLNNAKAKGSEMSLEDAQTQVAASAGSVIPAFKNSVQFKLLSGNPQYIEAGGKQMETLYGMGAGHALEGLSEDAKTLYDVYSSFRDSMQPTDAAREATNAVLNQDPAMKIVNQEKWNDYVKTSTAGGIPVTEFALAKFDMKTEQFINPSAAQVYGTNILSKYKSYYMISNGNEAVARRMTQKFIDQNYGQTYVNGEPFTTLHPIEKLFGDTTGATVPFIHQDLENQLSTKFQATKEMYRQNKTNEYWEVVPTDKKAHGVLSTSFQPVTVKRHLRSASGEVVDNYNVVLNGNGYDSWDVSVNSDSGMRSLFQIAPMLNVITYQPNKNEIIKNYNNAHPLN